MIRTSLFWQDRRPGGARWIGAGVLLAGLMLAGAVSAGWGAEYYLTIDVPAVLGGIEVTPIEVVRNDDGVYTPIIDFGGTSDNQFSGVHRRPDGLWLFSLSAPVEVGGSYMEPRDVLTWDGVSPGLFLDGSTVGIPDYAGIDALFLDSGGTPVLSFDVPVRLGATEYGRSDLVRYDGGGAFSLFWSGAVAGVPPDVNLVGADRTLAGTLVVSFDVPVKLGGTEFLPGTLVQWDNPGFSVYFSDPGWPREARLLGFALVPAPLVPDTPAGSVPDGSFVPGIPLTVTAAGGTDVQLSWGSSCLPGDTDYEVYEGNLADRNSHVPRLCSTGGATTVTLTPANDWSYFLVVPKNAAREGSYGLTSAGAERLRGPMPCEQQTIGSCTAARSARRPTTADAPAALR